MPARCPLHIVTGKGGVGKSTVALALAAKFAGEGARVVVAEVEGRGGLALASGRPVGPTPGPLLPGHVGRIQGVQIDPRRALAGYLQRYYRLGFAADLLQLDPLVDFATRIAPGLRDILLIGQVTHLTETHPDIDVLVLDAPPSGRIGAFLGAGQGLADLTSGSPIADQAASVVDDLRDPGCRTWVVTLLEELPLTETLETVDELRRLDLQVEAVVANRCLPAMAPINPAVAAPAEIPADCWRDLVCAYQAEIEAGQAQSAWQALAAYRTGLPVYRLPELPPEQPIDWAGLAAHLEAA